MSVDKIHQLVGSLAKEVHNNEKLATTFLAAKLNKCAAAYPQDKTLGGLARIMTDMVGNKTYFIRRVDLKTLGNKLYTNNTKFAELFQEELGEAPAEPTVTVFQHDDSVKSNPYNVGDQILANALESVFDKHIPLKMYSQPVANLAMKSVGTTLDAWNLRPAQLTVSDGNDKFIVIKADYETPKGVTSFYVPVEVTQNQVTDPEIFMGNQGPEDLNHANIKAYVRQQAGVKTKIGGADILNALNHAASDKREITATELAVIRLNASRQDQSEFFQGQVVGLHPDAAAKPDVVLPKYETFASFEEQWSTPGGQACWNFGPELVAAGRVHVTRELQSFGFTSPQVVVTKSDEKTIFYGVSLDTGKVAFTVPVKVADKKLSKPTVLLCNGALTTFDRAGINQLVSENKNDVKVASVASNMATLKPSEILNNLRQAMNDGNHAKAEDALNVLANCGDKKAYDVAFQVYMEGLSGKKVAETKCSLMVKSAVSEYPVCSHTGLPINKVFQDKDGNCRPLFRKGMDETYEGASFINAKIFG